MADGPATRRLYTAECVAYWAAAAPVLGRLPAALGYRLACRRGDWPRAETLRAEFMPLEDLRDVWGPARVLHHATELAGIAATGPIPPFVSELSAAQKDRLRPTWFSQRRDCDSCIPSDAAEPSGVPKFSGSSPCS